MFDSSEFQELRKREREARSRFTEKSNAMREHVKDLPDVFEKVLAGDADLAVWHVARLEELQREVADALADANEASTAVGDYFDEQVKLLYKSLHG